MSDQTWVIQTEDLQIGTVLSFDLLDSNGNVLHKSGMPISERLKERLAAIGITSVTIKGASEATPSRVESVLSNAFDPAILQAVHESISKAELAVVNAIEKLARKESIDADEVAQGVESFIDTAGKDLAAALSTLTTHRPVEDAESIQRLADRSAKLSLLGVVTCLSQGQSSQFALEVGMTGLLHDCSLIFYPRLLNHNGLDALEGEDLDSYRRHPIESAELLQNSPGIPERVLKAIAQVHEQADGSGFPNGLRLNETLYQAVILNIADAYLSLTDSAAARRFVQSDAIVYLINHSAKGKFCPKTIQSMMRGMSIYPIGTIVLLDDQTKAVVVRSNVESPMKPIVRTLNAAQQRIDLLQSNRTISGPYVDDTTGFQRVRKTELNKIFWRLDTLPATA
ncbi:HD-GYP domain-containing protein [Pirellulaceae bacterium SH467]